MRNLPSWARTPPQPRWGRGTGVSNGGRLYFTLGPTGSCGLTGGRGADSRHPALFLWTRGSRRAEPGARGVEAPQGVSDRALRGPGPREPSEGSVTGPETRWAESPRDERGRLAGGRRGKGGQGPRGKRGSESGGRTYLRGSDGHAGPQNEGFNQDEKQMRPVTASRRLSQSPSPDGNPVPGPIAPNSTCLALETSSWKRLRRRKRRSAAVFGRVKVGVRQNKTRKRKLKMENVKKRKGKVEPLSSEHKSPKLRDLSHLI